MKKDMNRVSRPLVSVCVVLCIVMAAACGGSVNQNSGNTNSAKPQASPTENKPDSNMGQIKVSSRPDGATVLLISEEGGSAGQPQPRGSTPTTITDVAPGKYIVHLEKPRYKSFQKSIEVKPGEIVRVTADLKSQK